MGWKVRVVPEWCPNTTNGYFIVTRWNKIARVYQVTENDVKLAHEKFEHKGMMNDVFDFMFSPDGETLAVAYGKSNYAVYNF